MIGQNFSNPITVWVTRIMVIKSKSSKKHLKANRSSQLKAGTIESKAMLGTSASDKFYFFLSQFELPGLGSISSIFFKILNLWNHSITFILSHIMWSLILFETIEINVYNKIKLLILFEWMLNRLRYISLHSREISNITIKVCVIFFLKNIS